MRAFWVPLLMVANVFSAPAGGASGAGQPSAELLLHQTEHGGSLSISASVVATTALHVTGEMTVQRKGRSGTTSTRQAGEFDLVPGVEVLIARISVSHAPGDAVEVVATITRDGEIIARETFSRP